MAFRTAPLSSGRIVSRVTIGRVTPFIPREKPNVKHAFAIYWQTLYRGLCPIGPMIMGPMIPKPKQLFNSAMHEAMKFILEVRKETSLPEAGFSF